MTRSPIRLLVAEDHPAVRKSILRLISHHDDIFIAQEAIDGEDALEKARAGHYDAVILDITMPRKNGLEVLRELRREKPDIPVLMLSIHPADEYKNVALALGAAAYIVKDQAGEKLIAELRRAVNL